MSSNNERRNTIQRIRDKIQQEYNETPFTQRFVWLLSFIMLLSAYAIISRPDNPVADYILRTYGIYPSFVSFSLFASGLLITLVYSITNNLSLVAYCCAPGILWFISLATQAARSATAPLMHIVTSGTLIIAIVFLFHLARAMDKLKADYQELYEQANRASIDGS